MAPRQRVDLVGGVNLEVASSLQDFGEGCLKKNTDNPAVRLCLGVGRIGGGRTEGVSDPEGLGAVAGLCPEKEERALILFPSTTL